MTKERAQLIWDRFKWWAAVVVIPLAVWAAKSWDASKVDVEVFSLYVVREQAADALRAQRDSARHERNERYFKFIICRQEHPPRQCSHLLP